MKKRMGQEWGYNMDLFGFKKAQPIWASKREKEKNCELAFRTVLPQGEIKLCLAGSTIWRIWINGEFFAAGPARVSHGYYSVDRYDLSSSLVKEANVIVIEVLGYNVNSYDTLNQSSFLTAEFLKDDEVVAYTGSNTIKIYELQQRICKVQRYSYQRAFVDAYRLEEKKKSFYVDAMCDLETHSYEVQETKKYIMRNVRYPRYEHLLVESIIETGKTDFDYVSPKLVRDRSYVRVGSCLQGFRPEELEEHISDEAQNMEHKSDGSKKKEPFPLMIQNGYGIYSFPYNATGFLHIEMSCEQPCTVYLLFDEILNDGKVDFMRLTSCNCLKYYLDSGTHNIQTFAPYTMKYVQVVVKGMAVLEQLEMVEYKHPPAEYEVRVPDEQDLKQIYKAALETYLANAVDVFSDCPSRERAGWLCDSYFISRVEHTLTGESILERVFLENFLRVDEFSYLPKGMLPMCYPADHYNGNFIPNWAMWFVLELEEYYERSHDKQLIDLAKKRVYDLLDYFQIYENGDGLLEGLKGWIFVEWSRANDDDVIQKINFPTNMLYMRTLQAVSKIYEDDEMAKKARRLRSVIRERSKKEVFFTDNEAKINNRYTNPGNMTEVCQYYAFFTGVATKEEDGVLWEILRKDFGYQRKQTGLYPEVAYANAFIGNYLRIELLYREGHYEEVVDNIRGYFIGMAKETGTLWEHDKPEASCNHGFASHVIYWLAGIYGISKISQSGTDKENYI